MNALKSIIIVAALVASNFVVNSAKAFRLPQFDFSFSFSPLAQILPISTAADTSNAVAANEASAVVQINAYQNEPTFSISYVRRGRRLYATRTATGTAEQEISSGSGFFVTSDGYILTNKHVVANTDATYRVNLNGSEVAATVVYRDPNEDLAIVKIDGNNYPTIALGDSSAAKVGDSITTIGNALGQYIDSTSQGQIVALNRDIEVSDDNGGTEALNGVIETNAKIYPGDSGGPLLSSDGQVIGIDTATAVSRRVAEGFSIPINDAKLMLQNASINF